MYPTTCESHLHVHQKIWLILHTSSENQLLFAHLKLHLFKAKFSFNIVLTDRSCEKGHLLCLLPIIIHSQVPDARVHVLYKACIVTGEWHQASLLGWKRRTLKPWQPFRQESTAIQQLHKVKLETRIDRQTTNKHYEWHMSLQELISPARWRQHELVSKGRLKRGLIQGVKGQLLTLYQFILIYV